MSGFDHRSPSRTQPGPAGTRFRTVLWFDEIDSTNRYLLDQARAGAPDGTVAVADYQRAGRGRLGRRWEAPAGSNLLMSVLLRPGLAATDLHLCTVVTALAAADACAETAGLRPELKWPNDLMVRERKLAGILAEAAPPPAPARPDPGVAPGASAPTGPGTSSGVRLPSPPSATDGSTTSAPSRSGAPGRADGPPPAEEGGRPAPPERGEADETSEPAAPDRPVAGAPALTPPVPGPAGVVVGLGLNVGWPGPDGGGGHPGDVDLLATATSLRRETGTAATPADLLGPVLNALERRLSDLTAPDGRRRLMAEYRRRCATLGHPVRVSCAGETFTGTATDVSDAGHLMVEVGGSLRTVAAGDVVHLRRTG